jgi:DNA-binding NarL/FixJ family response regulator
MAHRWRRGDDARMQNFSACPGIRVFLAEDSQPVRERIALLLSSAATPAMQVVGQAATPEDSIAGIVASRPDVVVLDVQLQGGTGLQVLRHVRQQQPQVAFVVLSNNTEPAYRRRYLGDGAREFLDKSTEFERLPAAVAHAHAHALAFSQGVPPCP